MVSKMSYELVFLPIAHRDMRDAAMYIADELKSPTAAANLLQEVRRQADTLHDAPYIYREYHGDPQNETIYRVMPVKNHLMFYTVDEESKTVVVHRFLYGRMDLDAIL